MLMPSIWIGRWSWVRLNIVVCGMHLHTGIAWGWTKCSAKKFAGDTGTEYRLYAGPFDVIVGWNYKLEKTRKS